VTLSRSRPSDYGRSGVTQDRRDRNSTNSREIRWFHRLLRVVTPVSAANEEHCGWHTDIGEHRGVMPGTTRHLPN